MIYFYKDFTPAGDKQGTFAEFTAFCESIKLITPAADYLPGADRITWKADGVIIDVLYRR